MYSVVTPISSSHFLMWVAVNSLPTSVAKMRMVLWGKVKRKCKVLRSKKSINVYGKADVMEVNLVPVFKVDFLENIWDRLFLRGTEDKPVLLNM